MNSLDKYNEIEAEERMRIIAQNGNNGEHYETNKQRKDTPVFSGFIKYFPNAIKDVARLSLIANDQHHPNKPLHWDMNKSKDELDSCMRHLIDHASGIEFDEDSVRHLTKCAWRMMGMLERTLTNKLD